MLFIQWLTKITNDAIAQDSGAVNVIGVGSNEDRRNDVPDFDEVSVESTLVIAGIWTSAISARVGVAGKSKADEAVAKSW